MKAKAKILVVDDDAHIRDYFVAILSMEDEYDLTTARDGEEALHAIEREQPDLVLLDYMMPKFSGIDVLRNLKTMAETDPRFEDVACIMITGKGDEGLAAAVVKAGASDYLSKPCPTERLLTTVEKTLKTRELALQGRREERRRLRLKALLQRILDLTNEGFVLTDLEGRISFANGKAAVLLGLSTANEAKDKPLEEVVGAEVGRQIRAILAGLANQSKTPMVTFKHHAFDKDIVLSFTIHSFEDETGERVGHLYRFEDLLEVQQRLDDSLSGASEEVTRYFIPMPPPARETKKLPPPREVREARREAKLPPPMPESARPRAPEPPQRPEPPSAPPPPEAPPRKKPAPPRAGGTPP